MSLSSLPSPPLPAPARVTGIEANLGEVAVSLGNFLIGEGEAGFCLGDVFFSLRFKALFFVRNSSSYGGKKGISSSSESLSSSLPGNPDGVDPFHRA